MTNFNKNSHTTMKYAEKALHFFVSELFLLCIMKLICSLLCYKFNSSRKKYANAISKRLAYKLYK